MVLSRSGRRSTYMRRDAGEEGGREFSSKMPRTISNLPDFPRRPFLYVHLLYSKSMVTDLNYKKGVNNDNSECRLFFYIFCYGIFLLPVKKEYSPSISGWNVRAGPVDLIPTCDNQKVILNLMKALE